MYRQEIVSFEFIPPAGTHDAIAVPDRSAVGFDLGGEFSHVIVQRDGCGARAWFALRVMSRHEKTTANGLLQRGLEEFLPLHTIRRRWSDRFMDVQEPFFPGYVFCRFDVRDRMPVLNTPGVVSIIGIGKTPAPVDDSEIAALRGVVKSGCSAQPWPFLNVGQFVRIDAGPLTGMVGRLVEVKKSSRLIISVTLLQRSVAVEIDPLWAYPVNGSIQAEARSTFVLR